MSHMTRLTRDRHTKYQNTIFHLEPNIKEGPGGLRDYQTLRWAHMLGEGAAPGELLPARDFQFRVRWKMHEIACRDNNHLDFAMQDQGGPWKIPPA